MTETTNTPAARVARYLAELARSRQYDPEHIHGLHVGSDREAVLTVADLTDLVAAKADAAKAREALQAILKVQVYGSDNIWAGSHRCKDIARKALATLTQRGA